MKIGGGGEKKGNNFRWAYNAFWKKQTTQEDLLRCRKGGKAKLVQILYSIALLSRPLVSMETRALRRAKWKVASTSAVFPPPAVFLTITAWLDIWTGKGRDKKRIFMYIFYFLLLYTSVRRILLLESAVLLDRRPEKMICK